MIGTISYIEESKKIILILALIFLCGILFGVITYPLLKEQTITFSSILKDLITSESKPLMAVKIFLKNVEASFVTLILGLTVIIPLLIVFTNGFATGLVMHMAYEKGKPITKITASLIPHGIFELTAFFLTAALGIKIGLSIISPHGKPRLKSAAESTKKALKTYITIVIPLLIIAALMETYISTQIIQ